MKRVANIAGAIVAGLIAYIAVAGSVVVHDRTGHAVDAIVANATDKQNLVGLPAGYFVAIPNLEGEVRVACSDGSSVRGGHVTWRSHTWLTVDGRQSCENLA